MILHYNQIKSDIIDVKPDKRNECFNWGLDNAFPSLLEALVNMSVTAKNCVLQAAKAVYGGSFGEAGKVIVNSKGQTLNELLRLSSKEYVRDSNVFLQIGYNANLDIKSIVLIPVKDGRIGKADGLGYSGKFLVYDNWDKRKGKKVLKANIKAVDRFNPDKRIVEGQIRAAAKDSSSPIEDIISGYNGQILHLKRDTNDAYALTDLFAVLDDMVQEGSSQKFRRKGGSKGFLNTKVISVQPFANKEDRRNFKKVIEGLQGAENAGEVLVAEAPQQSEDISKQLNVQDLSGSYNDKLFEYSDKISEVEICKSMLVPVVLVNTSDNSMFGNSGEMLKQAKLQLWDSRTEDRNQMQEVFGKLMLKFYEPVEGLEIVNPYEERIEESEEAVPEDVNAKAQATLRGSVGGVTALLQIQQSVAAKTTTKDSGIAMIVNIYGFDEETAAEMLGNPEAIVEP